MAQVTLTEFLLARIAEDEAIWGGVPKRTPTTDLALAAGNWPDGESAILLTTNRHAAECEAKRWMVGKFGPIFDERQIAWDMAEFALMALALPYADHPDYQPEWKP